MKQQTVAKIAVASAMFSIDRPYDYLIPESQRDKLEPGMRVIVPFGRGNRRSEGFVLALSEDSGYDKLKPIDTILDDVPLLDGGQIKLALWMRDRFFCTAYDALRIQLPAGIWYKIKHIYRLADGISKDTAYLEAGKSKAAAILDIIFSQGGRVELEFLKSALPELSVTSVLKKLLDSGVLVREINETKKIRDKTAKTARLAIPAEDALIIAAQKKKKAPLQGEILNLLAGIYEAETSEIRYFTGATASSLKSLERAGYIVQETREVYRRPPVPPEKPVVDYELSDEQEPVFEGLLELLQRDKAEAALLHGITGSGKTSIYIRLIERALQKGRSAIVLVPEIALTPQLTGIFSARFGDKIAVLHSSLGMGERYDQWKLIKNGEVSVVVGTRSAVFAPLPNLGIVIIDEEQEYTYKSENSPRYHARDVAKYRCFQSGALLLLGSATPAVESMYSAQKGIYHYFALETRYNLMPLPEVIIADMKKNLRQGNNLTVSNELRREIEKNLDSGEQTILFINRRGTSVSLVCGECGFIHTCRRCSVSLTYHGANNRLMCHYCGYSTGIEGSCPECGGMMKHVGAGTQKVQRELEELFPDIKILRMDTDTVTARRTHQTILSEFENKKIPILVGTQMVTKGLDFENVTLVGVISADQSLYVSDFRAEERTFSQITQVVGRAGRGAKKGRAVIQTYTPQNEVIRLAAIQDYNGFFRREVEMRRALGNPPVQDLISVTASGINESVILACCAAIKKELVAYSKEMSGMRVLGPAPAAVAKVNNRYRYRVTIICKNNKMVRELISHAIKEVSRKKDYRGVSVYGDGSPVD